MAESASWFCYIVRCKDASLYVEVATDPADRVKEHNWGVGAKFTARRRPVEFIWWEKFPDQKTARQRERELKDWRREKKSGLLSRFGDRICPPAARSGPESE